MIHNIINMVFILEILSHNNNKIWAVRKSDSTYWEWSFTHFDADMQVTSVDNSTAQPVPKYYQDPEIGSDSAETDPKMVQENLVWLISSNRDQSLLMLHQYTQGNFDDVIIIYIILFYRVTLWLMPLHGQLCCNCFR